MNNGFNVTLTGRLEKRYLKSNTLVLSSNCSSFRGQIFKPFFAFLSQWLSLATLRRCSSLSFALFLQLLLLEACCTLIQLQSTTPAFPPLKLDNTFLRTSDERVGEKGNISSYWAVMPTAGRQEDTKRWTSRRTEGLQTVMDVHRWWATERNERMGIILEVTRTDGGAFSAVDQQKQRDVRVRKSVR